MFHHLLCSDTTTSTEYISSCSRSKREAVYTCPVAESILSHFLTSPSKEYLWKDIGEKKITYTIPNQEKILTKQIFLCSFYASSLITVVLQERVLGRVAVLQYYSQPEEIDRGREAKIIQNKRESRTTEMPPLLQPVYLQLHFPSKWGTWDGTELLVQNCDWSKPHVCLTPSHLPHLGFDGGTSQGLGDRGTSAARHPIVDQEGARTPR